jgi:UDPglucose 6-dehydrogenase
LIPIGGEPANKPVCIIGTGYVGVASAIGLAELGCTIVGYDVDPERIAGLAQGIAPYREGHVDGSLQKFLRRRRMRFTANHADAVRGAGLILISVGTPALEDGSADLRGLWHCVQALAECDLSACDAIVIRSTVPPGTSDEVAAFLGHRAAVAYAPEFLREGSAVADFLAPDRTVVGADDIEASIAYARLFEPLGAPIMLTTRRNAELIKAASNAFLAIKITFANEVANLCDALGADSDEVLRGVGYDKRIGSACLTPGIGFGGPYVENDLRSLRRIADGRNVPFHLAQATLNANDHQPKRIVELVSQELGQVRGSKIAVWGLTFKAGTDDVRDSLAVRIVRDLVGRGASVTAFDPAVRAIALPDGATLATSAVAALKGADALLVLTEWPEFTRIPPSTIAHSLSGLTVVDGRNVLDPQRIAAAGLRYRGVGRAVDGEPQTLPVAI